MRLSMHVTRNVAREEHAFVWSDFWDAEKQLEAGTLNGVIVYLAYNLELLNLLLFHTCIGQLDVCRSRPVAASVDSCCLRDITSQLPVVTFDLKLHRIYRNAFIFLGLLRNLMITAILAGLFVRFVRPAAFASDPRCCSIIFLCAFINLS